MKKGLKVLSSAMMAAIAMGGLVACGTTPEQQSSSETTTPETSVTTETTSEVTSETTSETTSSETTISSTTVQTFTVTYQSAHGTVPETKIVASLTAEDLPALTAEGFEFGGWYLDETFTTAAQAGELTGNVTLYAKWIQTTFTVTFTVPDGVAAVEAQTVKNGEKAENVTPASYTESIEGESFKYILHSFDKWVVTGTETEFDFDTAITEDVSLTAVYKTETVQTKLDNAWQTSNDGVADLTDSFTIDKYNNVIVSGGGTGKFDKDAGTGDNYIYHYLNFTGSCTVTFTMTTNGASGILFKSDDKATSPAIGFYYDAGKSQYRDGYHGDATKGGAGQLQPSTALDDDNTVYVKLIYDATTGKVTYYVATDENFSDQVTKTQTAATAEYSMVGFFASEGTTLTIADLSIVDDNSILYSAETGVIDFTHVQSATYDANHSFEMSAEGNKLNVSATYTAKSGNYFRTQSNTDYLLFPETTENLTLTTKVTINSIATGTDKFGIGIGQFVLGEDGKPVSSSIVHFQKNKVWQHTYGQATDYTGNSGNPKSGTVDIGDTYIVTYSKGIHTFTSTDDAGLETTTEEAGIYMEVKKADGTVCIEGTWIKLSELGGTNGHGAYGLNEKVSYGFCFAGVNVSISGSTLTNEDGKIIYNQDDYFPVVGQAPTIETVNPTVSSDRTYATLNWTLSDEGAGSVSYDVYVSKDGADYTLVGTSESTTFKYALSADGNYKFKVLPKGGKNEGTAVESTAFDFVAPLAQTTLTASATSESASLSWTTVENALSYEIYRKLGVNGTYSLLTTETGLSYTDTTVSTEEAYTYYIVAKNETNSSNPSDSQQVVASNGHTGDYVYEANATTITDVAKPNDTVFANAQTLTLKANEAGTAKLVVNGTEVETKNTLADNEFSFDMTLADGRNDVQVLFTDVDGNTTRKTYNFVVNPAYNAVVDAAYTGTDGDEVSGYKTYKTVQAAVNAVPSDNTSSYVIFIKNGEYNERITISSPYVSLLGEDALKTHLYASVAVADKTATGMWDRNAMYVAETATGFSAENLTIENSFPYTNGSDQQADALCIVADQTICVNVRLLSYQDTLLTDAKTKQDGNYVATRQYFYKCYITGNVDFIYGCGSSYFYDCDIVARYTSYKSDGCFTAARTYSYIPYGFVFNSCRFLTEDGVADGSYRIARPWGADASTILVDCYLGRAISVEEGKTYGDMSGNLAVNARFAEYGSYGPGYALSNLRPYLSSTEASAAVSNVVSGFDYVNAVNALYKHSA